MFLHFRSSPGAAARARRALQELGAHDVWVLLTVAADADTLHAVTIHSRTLATAAVSKGSASFMTEHKLAPHALIVAPRVRRQSIRACLYDESGEAPLYSSESVLPATSCATETVCRGTGEER